MCYRPCARHGRSIHPLRSGKLVVPSAFKKQVECFLLLRAQFSRRKHRSRARVLFGKWDSSSTRTDSHHPASNVRPGKGLFSTEGTIQSCSKKCPKTFAMNEQGHTRQPAYDVA